MPNYAKKFRITEIEVCIKNSKDLIINVHIEKISVFI